MKTDAGRAIAKQLTREGQAFAQQFARQMASEDLFWTDAHISSRRT
jgi:hypothetical protein